jgi:uncharacterized membrane protein YdbT with pleckstrin-like domain
MGWVAVPAFSLKPSLLAAASTFARIVGVVALAFAVPLLVAWISGHGGSALAAIVAAQFGMAAVFPAAVTLLVPAIRLAATRYDLDAEGVRVRSSVLARSDQLVPWDKVTLLVHQRSIVERILGIESLTVVAYGVRGATLNLVGLHDAAPVRDYAAARMRDSASVAALFAND